MQNFSQGLLRLAAYMQSQISEKPHPWLEQVVYTHIQLLSTDYVLLCCRV